MSQWPRGARKSITYSPPATSYRHKTSECANSWYRLASVRCLVISAWTASRRSVWSPRMSCRWRRLAMSSSSLASLSRASKCRSRLRACPAVVSGLGTTKARVVGDLGDPLRRLNGGVPKHGTADGGERVSRGYLRLAGLLLRWLLTGVPSWDRRGPRLSIGAGSWGSAGEASLRRSW